MVKPSINILGTISLLRYQMTPKEVQEMLCEDCGFYHDCPMGYMCPPMELVINVLFEMALEQESKE